MIRKGSVFENIGLKPLAAAFIKPKDMKDLIPVGSQHCVPV